MMSHTYTYLQHEIIVMWTHISVGQDSIYDLSRFYIILMQLEKYVGEMDWGWRKQLAIIKKQIYYMQIYES